LKSAGIKTVFINRLKQTREMSPVFNEHGQPLGFSVPNWEGAQAPTRETIIGRYCQLRPLDIENHARELWESFSLESSGASWTYLPDGPFADYKGFLVWLENMNAREDMVIFAIVSAEIRKAVGIASYLRIDPKAGSIEVGYLHFSPLLQRTCAATEAMFLMMKRAFELGFRRYEWKCHALNAPSRRAALRLGFTFEGIFRQATVVKGHSRDTAWFSVVNSEWLTLQRAFEKWLAPANFDGEGHQKQSLEACRVEEMKL
jgi:RimJ/RimL family protein N-acetyltransferase